MRLAVAGVHKSVDSPLKPIKIEEDKAINIEFYEGSDTDDTSSDANHSPRGIPLSQ